MQGRTHAGQLRHCLIQLFLACILVSVHGSLAAAPAALALALPQGALVGKLTVKQTNTILGAAGSSSRDESGQGSSTSAATISFAGSLSTHAANQKPFNHTCMLSLEAITSCSGSASVLQGSSSTAKAAAPAPYDLTCKLLTSRCFAHVLAQLSLRFGLDTSDGTLSAMQAVPRSPGYHSLVYVQAAMALDASLLSGACAGVWPAPSDDAAAPTALWDGVGATMAQAAHILQAVASQLEIRWASGGPGGRTHWRSAVGAFGMHACSHAVRMAVHAYGS